MYVKVQVCKRREAREACGRGGWWTRRGEQGMMSHDDRRRNQRVKPRNEKMESWVDEGRRLSQRV